MKDPRMIKRAAAEIRYPDLPMAWMAQLTQGQSNDLDTEYSIEEAHHDSSTIFAHLSCCPGLLLDCIKVMIRS